MLDTCTLSITLFWHFNVIHSPVWVLCKAGAILARCHLCHQTLIVDEKCISCCIRIEDMMLWFVQTSCWIHKQHCSQSGLLTFHTHLSVHADRCQDHLGTARCIRRWTCSWLHFCAVPTRRTRNWQSIQWIHIYFVFDVNHLCNILLEDFLFHFINLIRVLFVISDTHYMIYFMEVTVKSNTLHWNCKKTAR